MTSPSDYIQSILTSLQDIQWFLMDNPELEDIDSKLNQELRRIDKDLGEIRDEHT